MFSTTSVVVELGGSERASPSGRAGNFETAMPNGNAPTGRKNVSFASRSEGPGAMNQASSQDTANSWSIFTPPRRRIGNGHT
jgi:hypothetical protein